MSEERRVILNDILREILTPLEERIEKMAQDAQEIKATLKRIEDRQELLLLLVQRPKE